MDSKNLNKMNNLKNLLVKNAHKIDLLIGILLIGYGSYRYIYNIEYGVVFIICGIISLALSVFKPVKKMDNYMNNKIINKTKDSQ